jgi:hypothetical protein
MPIRSQRVVDRGDEVFKNKHILSVVGQLFADGINYDYLVLMQVNHNR